MQEIATHSAPVPAIGGMAAGSSPTAAPLIQVLWRRRWTLAITMLACLCASGLYLLVATPIYRATAKVVIAQNGPKVFSDNQGYLPTSETFSETQRDVFKSASVLSLALHTLDYRKLKTFADLSGDPVAALQGGSGFDVDVATKSDVLVITMDSRYPEEAVEIVDSVVKAYIAAQADRDRSRGDETVKVLHHEREALETKLRATQQAMVKAQQAGGVLSYRANENGNITLERATSLSTALTNSQLATLELRGQQQSIVKALVNRPATATFVQGLQFKSRESGDREFDELRAELLQQRLALATLNSVQGINHPTVQVQQSRVQVLMDEVAQKERAITEAQLASVSDQLEAAEARERQLKEALAGQEKQAWDMGPEAARFSSLEADASQMRKQIDMLDQRVAEVSANAVDAQPMNVQVLDWATADSSPVSPRKGLTMLAALTAGALLGIGAAMLRDWQDSRVRTPEEALALMSAPLLAVVPRINPSLTPAARGQVVHLDPTSAAAEAYRSIRTSLSAGAAREAKTILVASPSREDGKSTTAGNLAITFAHAGHRTLLLDCDLRQPVQHLIFGSEDGSGAASGEGLTSALAGEVRISSIIYPTLVPGLCLLPCGPVPSNPSEMLAGKRFEQLLDSLAGSFDRVVIDSSSLAAVSDARSLAALADATLLVVRMNQSTRSLCALAMDSLLRVGANVAGVIANDVPMSRGQQEYYAMDGARQYAAPGSRLVSPARRTLGGGSTPPAAAPVDHPGVVMSIDEPEWSAEAAVTPAPGAQSHAEEAPGSAGTNGSSNGSGPGIGGGKDRSGPGRRKGGRGKS